MVETGCNTIMIMDQVASRVCKALSDANGHSGMWRRLLSPVKRGKALRRYYSKVMGAREVATPGLKTPDRKSCHSLLEKSVPLEFKEKLR